MAVTWIYDLLRLDMIVLAVSLIILFKVLVSLLASPLRKIPGPWYTTFTNLPLKLSVISGRKIYFIHKLHHKYGPVVRISPGEVAVADLESTRTIHKVGSGFHKTTWYAKLAPSPRDGVFVMRDPKDHAVRRKLFARPFSKTSLRANWEQTVIEKTRLAVNGIRAEIRDKGQADILKWWTFFATDVSGHLMFGESFRMLESGQALMGSGIAVELPLLARVMRLLPVKAIQQMFNTNKVLFDYAGVAVKNARQSDSSANIFSSMLSEADEGIGSVDDLDVQLEAGNLIVAGSDTTAVTLTYLTWALLDRPKLRRALEEEVKSLSDGFTDADLENLPLLNATIEESLRLYGAAPGSLPRTVPASGATLGGHFIPGGFTVSTQSWTLHRDPQLFEEPEKFDPYRFMSGEKQASTSTATRSAMLPFGSGSRVCLGIHLAYMELRHGIACFLRECGSVELSPQTTEATMKPENYFLIAPKQHECIVVDSDRR